LDNQMAGGLVLRRNKQRGARLGGPTAGWSWIFLPKKLAALLSPGLSALGQSVFLLIGYGAALRELCRQRIGGDVGRRGGACLPFVAAQPDCTSGEDKDEGHGR